MRHWTGTQKTSTFLAGTEARKPQESKVMSVGQSDGSLWWKTLVGNDMTVGKSGLQEGLNPLQPKSTASCVSTRQRYYVDVTTTLTSLIDSAIRPL